VRHIIERAAANGASHSEVFALSSLRTEVGFETNRLKKVSRTEERGVALRVVADGRIGFATSTKPGDVDSLVESALATARYGQEAEFRFASAVEPPEVVTTDERVAGLDIEDMLARAEDGIERILGYDDRLNCSCETSQEIQEIRVATSEGLDAGFERTLYRFTIEASFVEEGNFLSCHAYYGGTALDAEGQKLVYRVIENFKNARQNVDVAPGPSLVLLTPSAVADIMLTLNYAVNAAMVERRISPLTGRLGETIFDERITIYDDGLAKDGYATAPFDDEGVPSQRTAVIDSGVLKHFLTDLRTSQKLGLPPTGNGLRLKRFVATKDLGKLPAPEITNWEMAAGDTPHEELVARMSTGVIVDRIMGVVMGNLIAGDFSGNVSLGFKVENGKLRGRVKDTMIAGNVYELMRDKVVGISSDVERVGLLGGVGSHRYPYVLLKDVAVSTRG